MVTWSSDSDVEMIGYNVGVMNAHGSHRWHTMCVYLMNESDGKRRSLNGDMAK